MLLGLESVGKSALFRLLTGSAVPEETNFRGSTVACRRGVVTNSVLDLVDTPGIRFDDDSLTSRMALKAMACGDTIVIVARATHARNELGALLERVGAQFVGRRVTVVLTFADCAGARAQVYAQVLSRALGVPAVAIDARAGTAAHRRRVEEAVGAAQPLAVTPQVPLPEMKEISARATLLEHRALGAPLALALVLLLYGAPVYLAYALSTWLQPLADRGIIEPLKAALLAALGAGSLFADVLVGSYGLLTLGWYSFLWAFPVVCLFGASVAATDESGLRDRMTAALDPWLRRIGLDARDLTPVLTGYGCNVVAVLQSRASSACTRGACISLVAFGSACSYQMGAALSLFGGAGRAWLFAPYLLLLFVVGALHTRLWNPRAVRPRLRLPLAERAFLQRPRPAAIVWKLATASRQFLFGAMPIFLGICVVAAVLAHGGVLDRAASAIAPLLGAFRLPGETAAGVVFSMLRKDGLLVLHQGEGALLARVSAGQIVVLVYLSSTLTACLVTLWTIRRELGTRAAARIVGRQALTAAGSAAALAWGLALIEGSWRLYVR